LGIVLLAQRDARIGPVNGSFALRPALAGGAHVAVPPLGAIDFRSHRGPLALDATVVELRPEVARELAKDPDGIAKLGDRVGADLKRALIGLLVQGALAALLGCGLLSALVFRSLRRTGLCLVLCLVGMTGAAGLAAVTWRPESVREPRFTGLLASAPTAIGDAEQIVSNFAQYRLALGGLVSNVVRLYDVTSSLPTYEPGRTTVAVLHISDLHLNPAGTDLVQSLVEKFDIAAVLDTGDLTDHGSEAEGLFVADLARIGVPYVVVRGNHDSAETMEQVARLPQATVLDNTSITVAGLRVAGIADPRFTPDKTLDPGTDSDLVAAGERLAGTVRAADAPVSVALVHEPESAGPLAGVVPLVLAGHRHHREQSVTDGTLLLVEGSTGGAGLRGIQGEEPTPLECSVLYFDAQSSQLLAWDEITVGGLGETSVTVARHVRPKTGAIPAR
jgi:predicted phosphodiesterase